MKPWIPKAASYAVSSFRLQDVGKRNARVLTCCTETEMIISFRGAPDDLVIKSSKPACTRTRVALKESMAAEL